MRLYDVEKATDKIQHAMIKQSEEEYLKIIRALSEKATANDITGTWNTSANHRQAGVQQTTTARQGCSQPPPGRGANVSPTISTNTLFYRNAPGEPAQRHPKR